MKRTTLHLLLWALLPVCLLWPGSSWGQQNPAPKSATHPAVEAIPTPAPSATLLKDRKSQYSFTVGTGDWLDTGVTVTSVDKLEFSTTGSLTLGDGKTVSPDGVARGWRDLIRIYPLNTANSGSLIGRIGNSDASLPFLIGANRTLNPPSTGKLFLRANLSPDISATGDFKVKMKLARATEAKANKQTAPDLEKLLSPQLFQKIPRRVQDKVGNPGDMVNFAIIGTEAQVKHAFAAAGWVPVDKTTADAILNGLTTSLAHNAYMEMPVSTLYLFGRPQDLSFERASPLLVAASRHHLRVWKTDETVAGRSLWVGSATHDMGFERDQRNNGITHHIDPNIDQERDFIEHSFSDAGMLSGAAYVTPSNPLTTAKTATGGSFHSDGRIVVMDLKQ